MREKLGSEMLIVLRDKVLGDLEKADDDLMAIKFHAKKLWI